MEVDTMKIYPTCSLCKHYEPNSSMCSLYDFETKAMEQDKPAECVKQGHFIRDINVVLDSYHLFAKEEPVPPQFKVDLTRLPKDELGTPLFVMTKRGMERAVPAYPELSLIGDMLLGVHKSHTYQGQRELISDLGIKLAEEVASSRDVKLVVLEKEVGSAGKPEEIQRYRVYQKPRIQPKDSWIINEEEKW